MNKRLLISLIQITTHLVEGLLAIRILLKLLNASITAPFVEWTFETTNPLLHPFDGMFPASEILKNFQIEFSAIFAMVFYSFIGYTLLEIITLISSSVSNKNKKK
ncbi:MAG: YggT family protein [Candidatus Pacebacteria bacterium]|nr:YggT family protein [Candidatus Paceibacterota bacterium]